MRCRAVAERASVSSPSDEAYITRRGTADLRRVVVGLPDLSTAALYYRTDPPRAESRCREILPQLGI